MEEIVFRQRDAARALTGKTFLLAVASVVFRLALAQIAVNLLIAATGQGLLNVAFYLYAIALLVGFMRRTVASYVYTLKRETLVLERRLGDSTTTLVEIPLEAVVSLRPVFAAERLRQTYRQVTVIDPACKPPLRVRLAFAASLISARLARALAGRQANRQVGHVVVYDEGERRRACVFRPTEEMCAELAPALHEAYCFDERLSGARDASLWGRALEHAFPTLYSFVEPLVRPEDIARADAQIQQQKDARKASREARAKARRGGKADGAKQSGERDGKRSAQGGDAQTEDKPQAQDDAPDEGSSEEPAKTTDEAPSGSPDAPADETPGETPDGSPEADAKD